MAAAALTGDLPAIAPIGRVSPTLGEGLRACSLQVAFRLDERFKPYRRPGTAAALGIAAHELLEQAGNDDFHRASGATLRAELERRWLSLVAQQAEQLRQAWPLAAPPDSERWPGYELTHTRLIRSVADQLERTAITAAAPTARADTELWLEDADGVIGGRVDRVEHTRSGVRIVDLKSGWTVSKEITDAQRRQLLTYAYLWHANKGDWPTEAAIQHPDGTRLQLAIVAEAAQAAASDLRASRDAYNDRARSHASPLELAAPSSETCAWCAFKASCPSFFASAQAGWDWYRPTLLIDPQKTVAQSGVTAIHGKVLATTSTRTSQTSEDALLIAPEEVKPPLGRPLAIAEARRPGRSASLTLAWDSTLSTWETPVGEAFAAQLTLNRAASASDSG